MNAMAMAAGMRKGWKTSDGNVTGGLVFIYTLAKVWGYRVEKSWYREAWTAQRDDEFRDFPFTWDGLTDAQRWVEGENIAGLPPRGETGPMRNLSDEQAAMMNHRSRRHYARTHG